MSRPRRSGASSRPTRGASKGRASQGASTSRSRRYQHAREQRKNPTVPLILGAAAILVTGIAAFIFMRAASDSKAEREQQAAAEREKVTRLQVIEEPDPVEPPATVVEAAGSPADAAAGGEEKDVLDLRKQKKKKVRLEPQELPYPDSVPEDKRQRIDTLVAVATDLDATTEGDAARQALKEAGYDAVPPLLTRWNQLDMSNLDDIITANIVVDVLLEICGLQDRDYFYFQVQGTDPEHVEFRETIRKRWFRWWGENRDELSNR